MIYNLAFIALCSTHYILEKWIDTKQISTHMLNRHLSTMNLSQHLASLANLIQLGQHTLNLLDQCFPLQPGFLVALGFHTIELEDDLGKDGLAELLVLKVSLGLFLGRVVDVLYGKRHELGVEFAGDGIEFGGWGLGCGCARRVLRWCRSGA
jgi:hypothetical protein